MHTYQIQIDNITTEQQELLMAQLLMETEVEGFEEQENTLLIYATEAATETIKAILENNYDYSVELTENKNWNEVWESNFEPVQVGNFCSVRANFHPKPEAVEHDIIITPKMSFGTGHHATTYQMLQAMQGLSFTSKSVCDYGTGTGVLAILAHKLGASKIVAIDNDEWSINNTKENITENNTPTIEVLQAETIPSSKYDIILANINKNVLLAQMPTLKQTLANNGTLLLSGILKEDLVDMEESIAFNGLRVEEVTEMNNWLCIEVRHS